MKSLNEVTYWPKPTPPPIRTFDTGATRDQDATKPDYEGFLSPLVVVKFGEYMTRHRTQADGGLRDSDNWQKGIPKREYLKSLLRHLLDLWLIERGWGKWAREQDISNVVCAILFNASGYLHVVAKEEYEATQPVPPAYSITVPLSPFDHPTSGVRETDPEAFFRGGLT